MSKRLFIAVKIPLEQPTLDAFYSFKDALSYEAVKWVNPQGIHLTLKFLGDTDEDIIPLIDEDLQQIAEKYTASQAMVKGVGVFPDLQRPRVIWFGMDNTDLLTLLAQDIDQQMAQLDYEKEKRPFVPHITMGRIKYLRDRRILRRLVDRYKDTYFQNVDIDEFILFQSDLRPSGAVYTALGKYPLKKD